MIYGSTVISQVLIVCFINICYLFQKWYLVRFHPRKNIKRGLLIVEIKWKIIWKLIRICAVTCTARTNCLRALLEISKMLTALHQCQLSSVTFQWLLQFLWPNLSRTWQLPQRGQAECIGFPHETWSHQASCTSSTGRKSFAESQQWLGGQIWKPLLLLIQHHLIQRQPLDWFWVQLKMGCILCRWSWGVHWQSPARCHCPRWWPLQIWVHARAPAWEKNLNKSMNGHNNLFVFLIDSHFGWSSSIFKISYFAISLLGFKNKYLKQ